MKNLPNTIARLMALGLIATSVEATTVEERLAKQRELDTLTAESKIAEARAKLAGNGASKSGLADRSQSLTAPLPAISPVIAVPQPQSLGRDDFTLLGVFGIGDALEAEIRYRDVVFTVPAGAEIADGWKVSKLGPRFADLSRNVAANKPSRRKADGTHKDAAANVQSVRIYITSTGVKDVSPAAPRPALANAALPPLPPMPGANTPVGLPQPAYATGALLPPAIRTN